MVWIRNHDRPGRSSYPYLTVVILFYAGVIIRSKRFIILIHKRNYIFRPVIGYRIICALIVKSEYRTGPIPINDPFCRRMIRYKQFGIFIILYFRITELIPIARFQFICIDRLPALGNILTPTSPACAIQRLPSLSKTILGTAIAQPLESGEFNDV